MIANTERLKMTEALRYAISDNQTQALIINLNTRRQLYARGIDALGRELSSIGGTYTAYTLARKDASRPRNTEDHIDLFDTGDFYESFKIVVLDDGFEIEANTIKDGEDLRVRWGNEILGLTSDSIELLSEVTRWDVSDWVREALFAV